MSSKFYRKLRSTIIVSNVSLALFGGFSYYKNEEKFFKKILMPTARLIDAEKAHELAVLACKYKVLPRNNFADTESLGTNVCGLNLKNPIGIAAGFDKNGEAIEGLSHLGFGFVEIGSVTPMPQAGNQRPRVFRLVEDEAIINRYGFNSDGHEAVWHRLQQLRASSGFQGIVGVNLGKNKLSEDAVKDYIDGIKLFAPTADYLVINISSPNTPGLRNMQQKDTLKALLTEVIKVKNQLEVPKPVLLKLAPDLSMDELKQICDVIKRKDCHVDGLIISNTTVDRNMILRSKHMDEIGGLSGKPLRQKSTMMIEDVYKLTNGKIPIIGAGGISSGQDAFEKILAGASAVQIYSSFVYHGPPLVTKIKKELDELLQQNGYSNVTDAVGKGSINEKKGFSFFH